jgi:hypothetical protein
MKTEKKAAILAELVEQMTDRGSWCGETHIQKAVFCLQELAKVPMGYNFVLYKHGPFSFDLRDDITEFRVYDLFQLEPRSVPYGPSLRLTNNVKELKERFPKTLKKFRPCVSFVAKLVDKRGVAELERLATALFVTKKHPKGSLEYRTKTINELKPHVSLELAQKAVKEIDEIRTRTSKLFNYSI